MEDTELKVESLLSDKRFQRHNFSAKKSSHVNHKKVKYRTDDLATMFDEFVEIADTMSDTETALLNEVVSKRTSFRRICNFDSPSQYAKARAELNAFLRCKDLSVFTPEIYKHIDNQYFKLKSDLISILDKKYCN